MGFNETCAYLHSIISIAEKNLIEIYYDNHYCNHFKDSSSTWTLELSDSFRDKLGESGQIIVDNKMEMNVPQSTQKIDIPSGLGVHTIQLVR
jgi:hypothetical protein